MHNVPHTYAQESLWLADRITRKDGPAYNEPLAFRLTGALVPEALDTALRGIVERHEALRTAWHESPSGLVARPVGTPHRILSISDLRSLDPAEAADKADELVRADYRRPFDLTADILLRVLLVQLPGEVNILAMTLHHLAYDGWSRNVLTEELGRGYAQALRGGDHTQPPVPFADHARTERTRFEGGEHTDRIARWKQALEDGPELLRLPTDRPRPAAETFNGTSVTVTLPRTQVAGLLDSCRATLRSTDFAVYLAAYAVFLNRYTGQDTVTVGTTVLNRGEDHLDSIGYYANTAALPIDVNREESFEALVRRTSRDSARRLLDDAQVPYAKIVEGLDIPRSPSHNPVFQTMLTYLGPQSSPDLGEEIGVRSYPVTRAAAKFEFLLYVSEDSEHIDLTAEFNTDLFDEATVVRMLTHYGELLRNLADDLKAPVGGVSMLPEAERTLILDQWNDTSEPYPHSTVVDAIEEQVRRTPDAVAVEFEGRSLTYAELNVAANRAARLIQQELGDHGGPFVGVYMERSLDMVVALLAVTKAGCAYVPIDPDYPADRVAFMIEDAELPLVLTQAHHASELSTAARPFVLSTEALGTGDGGDLPRDLESSSPVYMIYTSGSTGRPKGVVNRHDALFNRLYWMQSAFGLTADDRVLQKTPFSFDVSVWEFFWPLMTGARIVVARPGGHRDPDYLTEVIAGRGVTTLHFVPSMLNVFLEHENLRERCSSLRRVICSGEALPHTSVRKFSAALGCELHNLYGPTEAAIDVSHWPCTADYPGSVVPIGRPIANLRLYVVDEHLRLLPVGVPGELCIGGVGVATGYHRREELNRHSFVQDPYAGVPDGRLYRTGDLARFLPDGQLQYLGRIDGQVKLRGLRIETDEVAAALRKLAGVKDAAVIVHEVGDSAMLAGYVAADEPLDEAACREELGQWLPAFMVPQLLVRLDEIPTTPNGKLDRRRLPAPTTAPAPATEDEQAATVEEKVVAEVWAAVLGIERVVVTDHFFRRGGDSLLAVRVAAKLRGLGYGIEVQDIFTHPTPRDLAAVLSATAEGQKITAVPPFALLEPEDRVLLPADAVDAWPLTRLQSGMIYHAMLHPRSAVYHDIFTYEFSGEIRQEVAREALRALVARHPQLRSTIDLESCDTAVQIVLRDLDIPVEVADLTGLDRRQQDETVRRWEEKEKQQPFDLEGPLFRAQVHLRGPDSMALTISFHHVVMDGWSVALLLEEFRGLYLGLLEGRVPGEAAEQIPYSTYVALEDEAARDEAAAEFWSGLVAGAAPTRLAVAESAEPDPAVLDRMVPGQLEEEIRKLAADLGMSAKSLFLTAHLRALGTLTQQRSVVTGLVSHGRPEVPGGDELVGLFLNTLPFPADLSGFAPSTPTALVEQVFDLERRLMAHRRYPYTALQTGGENGTPFDTAFNYTDFYVYAANRDKRLDITGARYFELTNFPVVVHAHRDHFADRFRLMVHFDRGRVSEDTVTRYLDAHLTALRELLGDAAATENGAGETAELERRITAIVNKVTNTTGLGPQDNYLDHGVDSITAIRIAAKIRRINPELGLADVINSRTVRELARRAAAHTPAAAQPDEPRPVHASAQLGPDVPLPDGVVDAYPATALQLAMIRATDADPAQAAYHDIFRYRIARPLDLPLLRDILTRFTDAHDTLRTSFQLDGPIPMQFVHRTARPRLELLRFDSEDGNALAQWAVQERGRTFDWGGAGLVRYYAHRDADDAFTLVLSFHHSIIDGWSLSLLMRDVLASYEEGLAGRPLPEPMLPRLRYRDYVQAELASRDSRADSDFWAERLRGHSGNPLPWTTPADDVVSRWSETRTVLAPGLQHRLETVARDAGVTLKHSLLAAHLRILGLLSDRTDIVSGVFTHGRLEEEGGDQVLGLFLNFLPHRQELRDKTWLGLVQAVRDADGAGLAHRRHPLIGTGPDARPGSAYAALFNYTEFSAYGELSGTPDRPGPLLGIDWFEHVDTPLLVNAGRDVEQERVVLTLNADGRLIAQPELESLAHLWTSVLEDIVAAPEASSTDASPGTLRLTHELRSAATRRT
ncbi:amino acid adenylation domain-containing protein [Streptomyces sp. NPDC056061]|uniref:amino acid adenylation domain-containing protein n=1 Tax=Streptomyces sp. NPDC056061 TaxID=3345700 RepID=UPI0035DD3B91